MKFKFFKAALVSVILSISGLANAGLIIDLYGDEDGSYLFDGGAEGLTDKVLSGNQSWIQNFVLDGTILSAKIEVGTGALGYFGVPTLWIDGISIGLLTDTDACDGSAAPGYSSCTFDNYAIDILDILTLGTLNDGIANISITTGSGDGWFLDYSKITIVTDSNDVPEPSTLAIFALGMIGLATRRFNK